MFADVEKWLTEEQHWTVGRVCRLQLHCVICVMRWFQPLAPVDVRALSVKAEFADVDKLKALMTSKDELVTSMKQLLKAKVHVLLCRSVMTVIIAAAAAQSQGATVLMTVAVAVVVTVAVAMAVMVTR